MICGSDPGVSVLHARIFVASHLGSRTFELAGDLCILTRHVGVGMSHSSMAELEGLRQTVLDLLGEINVHLEKDGSLGNGSG